MTIKVRSEVTIYEVEGKEVSTGKRPVLIVESHWTRKALVVLAVNGQKIAVGADDLLKAMGNATNT